MLAEFVAYVLSCPVEREELAACVVDYTTSQSGSEGSTKPKATLAPYADLYHCLFSAVLDCAHDIFSFLFTQIG